jgi:hypothetical protein
MSKSRTLSSSTNERNYGIDVREVGEAKAAVKKSRVPGQNSKNQNLHNAKLKHSPPDKATCNPCTACTNLLRESVQCHLKLLSLNLHTVVGQSSHISKLHPKLQTTQHNLFIIVMRNGIS